MRAIIQQSNNSKVQKKIKKKKQRKPQRKTSTQKHQRSPQGNGKSSCLQLSTFSKVELIKPSNLKWGRIPHHGFSPNISTFIQPISHFLLKITNSSLLDRNLCFGWNLHSTVGTYSLSNYLSSCPLHPLYVRFALDIYTMDIYM